MLPFVLCKDREYPECLLPVLPLCVDYHFGPLPTVGRQVNHTYTAVELFGPRENTRSFGLSSTTVIARVKGLVLLTLDLPFW